MLEQPHYHPLQWGLTLRPSHGANPPRLHMQQFCSLNEVCVSEMMITASNVMSSSICAKWSIPHPKQKSWYKIEFLTSGCCDQNHTKTPESLRVRCHCHLVERIASSWRRNPPEHHRSAAEVTALPSASFSSPPSSSSLLRYKLKMLLPPSVFLSYLSSVSHTHTCTAPLCCADTLKLWPCCCFKGLFSSLWTPGWLLLCLSATAIELEWTEEASAAHYHVVKPQTTIAQAGFSSGSQQTSATDQKVIVVRVQFGNSVLLFIGFRRNQCFFVKVGPLKFLVPHCDHALHQLQALVNPQTMALWRTRRGDRPSLKRKDAIRVAWRGSR